jgi:organic radical activating enzyme
VQNQSKAKIHYLSFHITNHCNLNCEGCYTLSNYHLDGHQLWKDYEKDVQGWSEKLSLDYWEIYGGEPTLNPTYLEWLSNLHALWPDAQGYVKTNGYTINKKNTKLYDLLEKTNGKIEIGISLHDVSRLPKVINDVKSFLKGDVSLSRYPNIEDIPYSKQSWVSTYNRIKGSSWPETCSSWEEFKHLPDWVQKESIEIFGFSDVSFKDRFQGYKLVDQNNVVVVISNVYFHSEGPLIPQPDLKTFKLHSSDPIKAHESCDNRTCREIFQGKLYKCNTVSHFPNFEQQFNIELTDEDREMLHGYTPCASDATVDEIKSFLNLSNDPIPQCKFCKEDYSVVEIAASTKKIKFYKRKKD